ncbi:hypothetical protein BABINDRAFT_159771 [Babjeviella inositovora NRRL Y-12698]|uniref:Amino acid transporter transmembrane domain-containing protein n=1 Tax=Babjeviella inositovora NRRL Y-12698 TaxID=984486 RepID=A0A1E3QUZ3_9ASCO|nr:uncharacterized protein BABINDRAFT_159771 [Babjeviella inositovora NRRL Y-12698]ODQ81491.1 hypothetical protein BABINDRAFT_159771 [Babjeviella inositovora NRRL Y-12698]
MAMPLVLKADGIVFGLAAIFVAGLTCGFGFYLQALTSKYVPSGKATFFSICKIPYPKLAPMFDLLIAFNCFGSGLSYLVLFADLMPEVTGFGSRVSWIVANMFIVVPLCFMRRLDSLKYTSFLALGAIGYMMVLICVNYFVGVSPELKGDITFTPSGWTDVIGTFSIPIFAFAGHQNMFTIINEANDKSVSNLFRIINISTFSSYTLYSVVGMLGYLTFGNKVQGNIMVMYTPSALISFGQGAIAFMVLLSYPLMFHPTRTCINNVYQHMREWTLEPAFQEIQPLLETEALPKQTLDMNNTEFTVITSVLLVIAYFFAFTVSSFGLVVAFIGATGCTSVAMIVPGIFGYGLIGRGIPRVSGEGSTKYDVVIRRAALGLAIYGVLVMVCCLYAIFVLEGI